MIGVIEEGGEDFDLVSRALAAGATYVFAPFAGYRYRRRSGSISHRFSAAQLDAMIAAAEGNIRLMELFVERGANIDYVSRIGEQAIAMAAWKGSQGGVCF